MGKNESLFKPHIQLLQSWTVQVAIFPTAVNIRSFGDLCII